MLNLSVFCTFIGLTFDEKMIILKNPEFKCFRFDLGFFQNAFSNRPLFLGAYFSVRRLLSFAKLSPD